MEDPDGSRGERSFFRAGQLSVCSHAVLKPKKKQVLAAARKAMALREEMDRAERNGVLVIEEEKG